MIEASGNWRRFARHISGGQGCYAMGADSNATLRSGDTSLRSTRHLLLISMKRGGSSYYYLFDGLGSTRKLVDSNQSVTDSYSYEAFGDITSSSGSTTNPYRYVGSLGYSYSSTVTSLLHVGARYYAPGMGRFMSQDPAGPPALSRYAYVLNNPVVTFDPTGLVPPGEVPIPDSWFAPVRNMGQVMLFMETIQRAKGADPHGCFHAFFVRMSLIYNDWQECMRACTPGILLWEGAGVGAGTIHSLFLGVLLAAPWA